MKESLLKYIWLFGLIHLIVSCDQPNIAVKSRFENGQEKHVVFYKYPQTQEFYQSITFYENGDTAGKHECYKGFRHGPSLSYYGSGNIKEKSTYHKGGRIDTTRKYFDTEQLLLTELIIYEDSSLLGKSTLYFEDGSFRGSCEYYNTQKQGKVKILFPTGLAHYSGYYRNDKFDGRYVEYFDHFHDTVIRVFEDGQPRITTLSTHPKFYRLYHLDSILFEQQYDTTKAIIFSKGCLLCFQRKDTIISTAGAAFKQIWNVPAVPNSTSLYVVSNQSLNIRDTIYNDNDSNYTKWEKWVNQTGEYDIQAIGFLECGGHLTTDTTSFRLTIK